MNRNEEYMDALAELEMNSPALEYTVVRARKRARNTRRIRRYAVSPISGLAALFIAFIILVNVSTPFALACSQVPILRDLALFVGFSPSLEAAVENDYVQPVGQEQSQNGVTMRIEYLIVDQKQLNVFYTLESETYSWMSADMDIKNPDGTELTGYVYISHGYGSQHEGLRSFTIDFPDADMPDGILLTCAVVDESGNINHMETPTGEASEPITTFEFSLAFDPKFTQKGELITLNRSFELDGQMLTVTSVEIYPTHMRLNLEDDTNNTAWLRELGFYMENEKGERFESIGYGVSAIGSAVSPMMVSHRLESSFFSESKSLTIYITGAVWLEKESECGIKIDLENSTAEGLQEGVSLISASRADNDWTLTFMAEERREDFIHQLFMYEYYDENGRGYDFGGWAANGSPYYDEEKGEFVEVPGTFMLGFDLKDYPYDTVFLSPSYTRIVEINTPVVITVK